MHTSIDPTHLDLVSRPGVEVDGADLADVHTEIAMNARAANAHKDAKIQ